MLDNIHPKLISLLGYFKDFKLVCSYRTIEAQNLLYSQGFSKCDGLNNFSWHNYNPSFAIDFAAKDEEGTITYEQQYYYKLGDIANRLDLTWGGNFSWFDGPHIVLPKKDIYKDIQQRLKHLGILNGKCDGIFGNHTALTMNQFQMDIMEPVTDKINPSTWKFLFNVTKDLS